MSRALSMCRWWVLSLMLIQPIFMVANVGADTQQKMYHVNIVAGTVAESLNQLSEQINIPVFFSYAIVKARQANAVSGQYTLHDVLEIMLQGTGLHGGLSNKGVLTISLGDLEASYNQGEDMMNRKKNILASTIAFFMGSGAGVVSAVDQNQVEELNHQGIDEIVVTAQKREQRLVDVPISISSVDSEALREGRIQDITDLSYMVPNLSVSRDAAGGQVISIRGVGNPSGFAPLTGIYFDEIPATPGLLTFDLQAIDLQRIEVLKGPQGSMYGQGSAGGTIRFVSKDPSFDSYEGVISLSADKTNGGGSSEELTVISNMPLIDNKLAFRLAATYKDIGWLDRSAGGKAVMMSTSNETGAMCGSKGCGGLRTSSPLVLLFLQHKAMRPGLQWVLLLMTQ